MLDHLDALPASGTTHSRWVIEQGYRSSYTVPLFDGDALAGFLFFDSRQPQAFTPQVVEQLDVYAQLVGLMISHEVTAVHALVLFAPLHDIGKIGVPDALLLKPGRYTPEERRQMQRHVALGSDMVERLIQEFRLGGVAGIDILRRIVACHHEFLDGSGYPQGLRGDAVPLEARIVTVADIFDALSNRRVYKDACRVDDSLNVLDGMAAHGQLDARCVAALRAGQPEVQEIIDRFAEEPGAD